MPYKAWCPVCVAGEGIHNQSRQTPTDERERIGITVSMDFCFLTTDGEADKDPKILILHDDRLETLWALGVKSKAVTPEVVTWIMSKLEEAGYKRNRDHAEVRPRGVDNGSQESSGGETRNQDIADRVQGKSISFERTRGASSSQMARPVPEY